MLSVSPAASGEEALPRTWLVAAGGTGDCASAPCGSLAAAYHRASPGDRIELAAGAYPDQVLPRRTPEATGAGDPTGPDGEAPGDERGVGVGNIVVLPAPGADVELGAVDVHAPGVTISGVSLDAVTFRATATGSGVDRATFRARRRQAVTMLRGATRVFVTRSSITGGADHDRVQVQGAVDARLEGNLIGGTVLSPGSRSHVDCLQVLAADGLVVRRNVIYACAGQTIFIQDTFGWGVQRLVFERNWVQDCGWRDESCNALFAVQVNTPGTTWLHNTVAGAMYVRATAPTTLRGNIIGALLFDWSRLSALCTGSAFAYNLVTTNCPTERLNTFPNTGNELGLATFVGNVGARPNPTTGPDLHLVPDSRGVDVGSPYASDLDIDGDSWYSAPDLGADEHVPAAVP